MVQTINDYTNGNYTGAEELATTAYLDDYKCVEAPLAEKDKPLMETTKIMMREELMKIYWIRFLWKNCKYRLTE